MFGHKSGKGALVVDGKHVADTVQCVHCGKHWVPQPGSGIERGWCMNCNGICCGSKACMECVPHEAWLEMQEGQKVKSKYIEGFLRSLRYTKDI